MIEPPCESPLQIRNQLVFDSQCASALLGGRSCFYKYAVILSQGLVRDISSAAKGSSCSWDMGTEFVTATW